MPKYIYQYKSWPHFTWQESIIHPLFGEVKQLQGSILGQMKMLGFTNQSEAALLNLTNDVVKSSEIEGEKLNYAQVRSSIARKLGISVGGMIKSNRNVDGVVEMMIDATRNYQNPLTYRRLCGWHAALFPTGYSGMHKIEVGRYRSGEMQVISGALGKEKLHYEAVPAANVREEMKVFIDWFNEKKTQDTNETFLDSVIKAAIAHFWFIIIHPFDDGNGRIARALSDLYLSRSDGTSHRFYSMSSQIMLERKKYYEVLQEVQHSHGDITMWLKWFMECFKKALYTTEKTLENTIKKKNFWDQHAETNMNERQRLMVNKLFDGLEGKLQSSKWAKMTKCSSDTALRDIKDLIEKGILRQEPSGGRSTNYELNL